MTNEEMVKAAENMGFSAAAVIATKDIPFEAAFRVCCEDNSCGKYGINYSCPPDCGTTAEMEAKIKAQPYALLLQTIWEIDDPMEGAETKKAKKKHNAMIRQLIDDMQAQGTDGFMIGSSGCSLCEQCAITENEPCRFPDKMFSCMSAYCVYVNKLAEKCGIEYDSGQGLVSLYGMFVFHYL